MKVKVGISNRHVHLTKQTYEYLFGKKELEKKYDLNQIGEFASTDTVDLEYNDHIIRKVRIVGPFRNHNQIELLGSDCIFLRLITETRRSGDLTLTPKIKIINDDKFIYTDGVIRALNHIHVPSNKEKLYNLYDKEIVQVKGNNFLIDAEVKVSENGYFELHIDKDVAYKYDIKSGDILEIIPKK